MRDYRVIYEFDTETGQVMATVPELNYVSSFGADFAEAERNIKEAVLAYLEALAQEGKPFPEPAEEREGTFLRSREFDLAAPRVRA